MTTTEWKIAVGADETRAVYEPATSAKERAVYVCAHGAGGNMSDRSILAVANQLRGRGFGVVRFNFLYKQKGSSRPDAMPKLLATFTAVVERTRSELPAKKSRPLIIGGRSMGGRAASMLAADGFDADGLLLLAYPLHPPGQPEKLRDEHLQRITMPAIFFCGTRDPFCTPALMERAVATIAAPYEMHWVEAADHSFHVPKSSGRTDAAVLDEVGDVSERWLSQLT